MLSLPTNLSNLLRTMDGPGFKYQQTSTHKEKWNSGTAHTAEESAATAEHTPKRTIYSTHQGTPNLNISLIPLTSLREDVAKMHLTVNH